MKLRLAMARIEEIATIAIELSFSLIVGFGLSLVILTLFNYPALECISTMITAGFTDVNYLLNRATPLIATGIAFAIPMLAGLFNIGSEGQLYIGTLTALIVAWLTANPILALLSGVSAGAGVGALIGFLKAYRGVNEVVTSIMVNWILYYFTIFTLTYYLFDPAIPHQSISVPHSAQLGAINLGIGSIGIAFVIVMLSAIIAYVILYRSTLGYAIRVVGYSLKTAVYAGIDPRRVQVVATALGGAFAGLGGALYLQGYIHVVDVTDRKSVV